MAALTANRKVPNILKGDSNNPAGTGLMLTFQSGASEQYYIGGFVGLAADKYATPLAAGEQFVGIFHAFKGSSTGTNLAGGTDGDNQVDVISHAVFQHAITSIAQADIGKAIYASDDQVLTLVHTSNSGVGRVINVYATGTGIVQMTVIGETQVQAVGISWA
jgi:hypothetical protein